MANTMSALQALNAVFTKEQAEVILALLPETDAQHTHAIGDVSGLQAALNGKANTSHTHTIANVSGLQAALDGKAASSHTHAIADISGLAGSLSDIEDRLDALENPG